MKWRAMPEIVYDKLVRDLIPQVVAKDGKHAVTRVACADEYPARLADKLAEEAAEFREKPSVGELADVMECVLALCACHGFTMDEVERERLRKRAERGGFDARIILDKVVG